MCGITGFIDFKHHTSSEVLDAMVSTLEHRGPDDRGTEVFETDFARIGLGHTRLSILDLSYAGHQPMKYRNLVVTYNGEVYNYREIRQELSSLGHEFKTNTDTEVILHAFAEWHIACVNRFVGMFAFIIYDTTDTTIYGFRDRVGVKPFYYYKTPGLFLFASELKSFYQHPQFDKKIDQRALLAYFDFGYIPAPYSIFVNTYKLEPGHYFIFNLTSGTFNIKQYWNVLDYYTKPKLSISYNEAKEELLALLLSAFSYRMVADVPVGVFLSGGYDSTAVVAILQQVSSSRLKTFTIGFEEGNNEAPYARQTAAYLGTDHHEMICTTNEAQEIIQEMPYYYDEPFADSSSIPTMLVSKFAKTEVTVALSADGGDEIFAGYQRYISFKKKTNLLNIAPSVLKPILSNIFLSVEKLVPSHYPAIKHKIYGFGKALNNNKFVQAQDLYKIMNSLPISYSQNLFNFDSQPITRNYSKLSTEISGEVELTMVTDYLLYLPDDILTKVDRATMSTSLEGREPFLDHRIVEYVAQLPVDFKYPSKRILKEIVHGYVPKSLMDRPKAGFSLPIYSWLRKDLSYLLDEYLNENSLAESGFFNMPFLLKQIKWFKTGRLHYSTLIWKVLMFQMWYKKWVE